VKPRRKEAKSAAEKTYGIPVALGRARLLDSALPTHAVFSNQFTRKSEISGE
jgi:hypothetical protein